jgi:hypothetical protein
MKEMTTTGLICLRDDLDIEYKIAKIVYTEREDESFTYVFTPYYNVIDLLSPPVFQGIPGLDLDLRKPDYVRENSIPVFISERAPGKNREDLWELLKNAQMKYLNQLEWLIRTKTRYPGDRLYVKKLSADDEKQCVELKESIKHERARAICNRLLKAICYGHDVKANGYWIDDSNRKEFYSLLISLYQNEIDYPRSKRIEGIRRSAVEGNYRGRQRIQIDDTKAIEVFNKFRRGKTTEAEALEKLGISRATFYRRLKEHKKKL